MLNPGLAELGGPPTKVLEAFRQHDCLKFPRYLHSLDRLGVLEEEVLKATNQDLAAATNAELADALTTVVSGEPRQKIIDEANRRKVLSDRARPFNPKTDLSADAQYLWKRIFIWFWAVPVILGLLIYLADHIV